MLCIYYILLLKGGDGSDGEIGLNGEAGDPGDPVCNPCNIKSNISKVNEKRK